MALNNRENMLLNSSSVIPYFILGSEKSDPNVNLVFFEANNVNEEMIYSGCYHGRVVMDEYDNLNKN